MFRIEESFIGGWQEKTIEAMQRRRFNQMSAQLQPLGMQRLESLSLSGFVRRIEHSWQSIERKPMRVQQLSEIWQSVLQSIDMQADCLSSDEHDLVERALILGGSAQIEDMREMEAARALSLRLWANVGLINGKPYIEIEKPILHPAAKAFARREHDRIRQRFDAFNARLEAALYQSGAIDDSIPHEIIVRDVLRLDGEMQASMLARRYLWSSFDCVDHRGRVLLLHHAVAEPYSMISDVKRKLPVSVQNWEQSAICADILPEEVPYQKRLELSIAGKLRAGCREDETARNIRFLCKQGAPLSAMQEVLGSVLIVMITPPMRAALRDMYYGIPKWIEADEQVFMQ